jgi:uncharacterized membrane protein YeaQ/YmgE (transglycosylase-associated protein family)
VSYLGFVVIGAVAGWLAGRFMRGDGFGLAGNMVAGIAGSFAGGMIGNGLLGRLLAAFIGAVVVLFVVHVFTGRRNGRRLWS